MLLQGNKNHYEKVAASVLQDLMGTQYDVYKLTLPELFYLFFVAKASTLGPVWTFSWVCPSVVLSNHQEVQCGCKNSATYDLRENKPGQIPVDYSLPKRSIELVSAAGGVPGDFNNESVSCYIRPLALTEEFEILDTFLGEGSTREKLLEENAYDLYIRRLASALVIDHPAWVNASSGQKEALLDANPMKLKATLLQDCNVLDDIGYPLSTKSVCTECSRAVTLRLPFLAGLVVRAKP